MSEMPVALTIRSHETKKVLFYGAASNEGFHILMEHLGKIAEARRLNSVEMSFENDQEGCLARVSSELTLPYLVEMTFVN